MAQTTFKVVTHHVETEINMEEYALRNLKGVQETSAHTQFVCVVRAVTSDAYTSIRNKVPNTVGIVTAKQIAQIEQNLLFCIPELNLVVIFVLRNHTKAIPSLQFGAETDARSEPLTNSNRETETATEILERTLCITSTLFLV